MGPEYGTHLFKSQQTEADIVHNEKSGGLVHLCLVGAPLQHVLASRSTFGMDAREDAATT